MCQQLIFHIIKPTRCTNFSNLFLEWNSTCFGEFLCPSSGIFHCTHSNGICHTGLLTACEQDQDGTAVISQIYSWNETLHISESSSVHHQEFFIVHTAMVYAIQVCWQLASRIRMELQFHPDPARKLSANLYDIPLLCGQWKTSDDGQRNCTKHVEFHFKNKFEKLVHLVGFIIRNSSESQHWVDGVASRGVSLQSFFSNPSILNL